MRYLEGGIPNTKFIYVPDSHDTCEGNDTIIFVYEPKFVDIEPPESMHVT